MSTARQLSVYDDQRWIGSITDHQGRLVAKDTDGHKVGSFDTLKDAADAIGRKDARTRTTSVITAGKAPTLRSRSKIGGGLIA
ncbi:MAG: hypothetical protein ACLPTZ_24000 [Beijerinckiaceae bacterium]